MSALHLSTLILHYSIKGSSPLKSAHLKSWNQPLNSLIWIIFITHLGVFCYMDVEFSASDCIVQNCIYSIYAASICHFFPLWFWIISSLCFALSASCFFIFSWEIIIIFYNTKSKRENKQFLSFGLLV